MLVQKWLKSEAKRSFIFFFFQAEDGIRVRSPSRGLGDVYKRQDYWGIAVLGIGFCVFSALFKEGSVSFCSGNFLLSKALTMVWM